MFSFNLHWWNPPDLKPLVIEEDARHPVILTRMQRFCWILVPNTSAQRNCEEISDYPKAKDIPGTRLPELSHVLRL